MLLKVTFSEDEIRAIDLVRGATPRATWVREVVRDRLVAGTVLEGAELATAARDSASVVVEDASALDDTAVRRGIMVAEAGLIPRRYVSSGEAKRGVRRG